MSHHRTSPLKIAAIWAAIALAGLMIGWLAGRARAAAMLAELVADAERSALSFDAGELQELTGSRADLGTPAYDKVKQRLRRLQSLRPDIRFVYIFRVEPDTGRVIFLADSAAPGDPEESLPGDEYPEAAHSPGLQESIRLGISSTEGPLADSFGTWVTGYSVIEDFSADGSAEGSREILGLDLEAARWRHSVLQAGLQGAFYAWVIMGLPFLALLVSRRQVAQQEVIRNLSEAMEQSHSAIMIIDLNQRIEFANRGLCRQLGFARRDLIGREWREFYVAPPSHDEFSDLLATIRAGRTWEGEWQVRRRDGSVYPAYGVVTPVRHPDASLACFVAVFDDITDRKRREAELREARDRAEAGDQAKGRFLATMSHEVRTPLNGIVGFTSLLMETPLTSEQREYVQTIRLSTEALIHLTGDILDLARIESGKLKLELVPCDPRECLEEALDLLAAKAAEKDIELLHRVAPNVPGAILTDGGRLRQVLVNLVGNAVKFTERGEVEVSLELVPAGAAPRPQKVSSADWCVLQFSVRDTGIGIAADQQGKLFKPFSQVDETTTRRYGGTGLGLAISHNLVRLMGGEIGVTSAEGAGSTFRFTIAGEVAAPAAAAACDLGGLPVALIAPPGRLRAELAGLLRDWHATVLEAEMPDELAGPACGMALVDVDETLARKLAARSQPSAGLPPAHAAALVPVTLSSDLRSGLRTHFRALVNKPVHHAALFALLAGARTHAPIRPTLTRFGYRVLVVEDNAVSQRLMEHLLAALGCVATVVAAAHDAIRELTVHTDDYDLVLVDLNSSVVDGINMLANTFWRSSGRQAVWTIALVAEGERERGMVLPADDFLTKPMTIADLEAALRRFRANRTLRKT